MDGVGEWATTSVGDRPRQRPRRCCKEIHFPHSLGLLYSAFTYYTGFKVNSGEYKVMGLAPYGEPKFAQADPRQHLIDLKPDGIVPARSSLFRLLHRPDHDQRRSSTRCSAARRASPSKLLTQRHMDLAASIQAVTEEVVLRLTRSLATETGAEESLPRRRRRAQLRRQRQGAARRHSSRTSGFSRRPAMPAARSARRLPPTTSTRPAAQAPTAGSTACSGAYLGPTFARRRSRRRLTAAGARFTALDDDALIDAHGDALADGKAVGWFQGRMEFGPRALGNRSILGDPRSPAMQTTLNLKVKYRESFRPFAPSVLREDVADWFELDADSPYMLLVADVAQRPAARHDAGGTGAVRHRQAQRAALRHSGRHPRRLFGAHPDRASPRPIRATTRCSRASRRQTGCPVLVNTSFNVRGEPIVCTPEDAFRCFMGTEIDALAVGNLYLLKDDQDPSLRRDYKGRLRARLRRDKAAKSTVRRTGASGEPEPMTPERFRHFSHGSPECSPKTSERPDTAHQNLMTLIQLLQDGHRPGLVVFQAGQSGLLAFQTQDIGDEVVALSARDDDVRHGLVAGAQEHIERKRGGRCAIGNVDEIRAWDETLPSPLGRWHGIRRTRPARVLVRPPHRPADRSRPIALPTLPARQMKESAKGQVTASELELVDAFASKQYALSHAHAA